MSQGGSHATAAAYSRYVSSAEIVSCGRVTSKDVLYSDDTMYF